MVWCKQWCLGLAAMVVVVTVFGALVGVTCWHMAYQEASLQAALREQRTLNYAKSSCRRYVAKMLQMQPSTTEGASETSLESETFHSESTDQLPMTLSSLPAQDDSLAVIGMLTSQDVMMYTAQEAIQDLVRSGFITLQPRLVSPPRQPEETLAAYLARLHHDSGVQVLLGWLTTTEEVQVVANWAKGRPRPVVLVLPSAPAGWWAPSLEEQLESDFVVLSMTPSPSAALPASLLQMFERRIKRVLPVLPETASADILAKQLSSWNLSSLNLEIFGLVRYNDSMSAEEVISAADDILQKDRTDDVGLLFAPTPDLVELITSAAGRQVSQIPWFIATNKLPDIIDAEKSLLGSIDLNAIEYHEKPVIRATRYKALSERIRDKVESTHVGNIALVYDAAIIASRIGYWFTRKGTSSLSEVLQQVSWESSSWAGLTGALELTEDLERSLSYFTCVHLAVEDYVTWRPTGRIQVSRSAHTITLVSSSADTYVVYDEE